MDYPFVAFSIDADHNLKVSHQRDPGRAHPLEVKIPLKELELRGYAGAAQSIGELTLTLFSKWYKEEMSHYPELIPSSKP